MRFNAAKCNIMRMSRKQTPISTQYELSGQVLEEVKDAKYLGVTVSNDLEWTKHINAITTKPNSKLSFLRRNLKGCPEKLRETAYFALVRSFLEYSATVWHPHQKYNSDKLEMVQRRAARFVKGRYGMYESVTQMLEELTCVPLSKCLQLLTCHDLAKVVNDSGQVDMLVLDFAKAFDTVAHKRLLGKLESYGIDGNLYGWIQSFLEGRTQRVGVDGETSGPASVKSGVPQGSVLGPLLFLIFINDLAEHTTSTVRLFADDCVMYKSVKSVRDCQELQQDLIQLQAWQERWLLRFNPRKCNIMRATHATRKKIEFPYALDDTPLADTPSTSYLGVELSSDLRWNKQVKKTVAKGNQTLGVLKRNLRHCPRSIKDMAYKTILRPKLEYASAVWDPFTEDNIRKLEAVQRRAARFVCNSYRQTASVSSMLSELSWPLLEQRRAEARLGLFHRIVHKSVDIDAATLMTRSTRLTRKANEVQYTRHMTSKDCYKFSFIPRTIIQWNGIAATGDFNQYKSDLKSHDLTLSGPSYKRASCKNAP